MPTVTYVEANGAEHVIEVDDQMNLMEGATINMIPGIDGMCGGICSCCTCHVYIEGEWAAKLHPPAPGETRILEKAKYLKPSSRLGCQITITDELDGIRVQIPEAQGQVDD
jgi:ferredoxin, 2Fe-2S